MALGPDVKRQKSLRRIARTTLVASLMATLALPTRVFAQVPAEPPAAATAPASPVQDLRGRTVEEVRITGNVQTPAAVIRNLIRTRVGEPFDPATVEEDYQRVYGQRKFSNVQARVEPTAEGVIVIFDVTEQQQVRSIAFKGNVALDTPTLSSAVDLKTGEAIEPFRITLARQAIERLYRERNFPYAHVEVPQDELAQGNLVFRIVEGPRVRVRRIQILGNHAIRDFRLRDQIRTKAWFPIFVAGILDLEQLDDDVAAIRRYYEDKGFFDVRVGRKLTFSPDHSEVMVTFVVDEGQRYTVDRVSFKGNLNVSEAAIREKLKLVEGRAFDQDLLRRDIRQVVRAYSPYGYIYQPQSQDPDYLRVEPRTVFRREAGTVELVYDIHEGKPFYVGRILVKGNAKTQDKVVLRELRVTPGQLYNSGELQDAVDRLRSTRLFTNAAITPVGEGPTTRDVLVEVNETQTAFFTVGAALSSNAGVLGNISYEQRNFDISNVPGSWDEFWSTKAFTGAGQYFRILLEPGTEINRARVTFQEPYLFDQPYSLGTDFYYWTRQRDVYDETRGGATIRLGKRFNNEWSSRLSLRGEDVEISDIEDRDVIQNGQPLRAPDIVALEGHSTLTSVGIDVRRNTTDSPLLPSRGSDTTAGWEYVGALGGDFDFHKFTLSWNYYQLLAEDLLDRKTILSYRMDAGYIEGDAPFFERFYGGGLGSVRGFRYRGISPRQGADDDPVGGDFSLTGSIELGFPIASDTLRGVVFTDAGTVEEEFGFGTIRTSVGAGIRLTLPLFGQAPLAIDFAVPLNKDDEDRKSLISFSFGFIQ